MPLGELALLTSKIAPAGRGDRRGVAVYEALCQSLRLQHFRPGERIVEDDIAAKLGISRTPVREALNRLRARGLIQPAEGGGFAVVRLGHEEVSELYTYRAALESAVGRAAAQHATDADIEAMRDLNEQFLRSWGETTRITQANRRFHSVIYQSAHNRYLAQALDDVLDHVAILGSTTLSELARFQEAYEEHQALIAAIRDRDASTAEQISRRHVLKAQGRRLAMLSNLG